jgi:hypothetical protein
MQEAQEGLLNHVAVKLFIPHHYWFLNQSWHRKKLAEVKCKCEIKTQKEGKHFPMVRNPLCFPMQKQAQYYFRVGMAIAIPLMYHILLHCPGDHYASKNSTSALASLDCRYD